MLARIVETSKEEIGTALTSGSLTGFPITLREVVGRKTEQAPDFHSHLFKPDSILICYPEIGNYVKLDGLLYERDDPDPGYIQHEVYLRGDGSMLVNKKPASMYRSPVEGLPIDTVRGLKKALEKIREEEVLIFCYPKVKVKNLCEMLTEVGFEVELLERPDTK